MFDLVLCEYRLAGVIHRFVLYIKYRCGYLHDCSK